jgi:putative tryptophan/tyrosine transport system substrate-binding protein
MKRRDAVFAIVALGAAAGPFAGFAQQPGKARRILQYTGTAQTRDWFLAGMRDLGWIEGRNVTVKVSVAPEVDEAALRSELLDRNQPVDAVVMAGALRIRAAMNATATVPIIGIDLESDPVAAGFVKSLARPGANVSGVWMDLPELAGKHLQLLREAVPHLARVGALWDDRFAGPQFAHAETAARASNMTLSPVTIHGAAEIANALERLLAERAQALLVLSSPTIFVSLPRVAELARDHHLPSVCLFSTYADVGGLLSYGPDFSSMYRLLASYVDRILKGARIGDLPIERPTKFELVINLKTAKALGLQIPPSVLQRADRVIE